MIPQLTELADRWIEESKLRLGEAEMLASLSAERGARLLVQRATLLSNCANQLNSILNQWNQTSTPSATSTTLSITGTPPNIESGH